MGQLSLPGYISSFEPPRPDNAPGNARDLRPPSLPTPSAPRIAALRAHLSPRRRVKLQILHPFARLNTAAPRGIELETREGRPRDSASGGKFPPEQFRHSRNSRRDLLTVCQLLFPPPPSPLPRDIYFRVSTRSTRSVLPRFSSRIVIVVIVDNEDALRDSASARHFAREADAREGKIFGLPGFARIFGNPCIRQMSLRPSRRG